VRDAAQRRQYDIDRECLVNFLVHVYRRRVSWRLFQLISESTSNYLPGCFFASLRFERVLVSREKVYFRFGIQVA